MLRRNNNENTSAVLLLITANPGSTNVIPTQLGFTLLIANTYIHYELPQNLVREAEAKWLKSPTHNYSVHTPSISPTDAQNRGKRCCLWKSNMCQHNQMVTNFLWEALIVHEVVWSRAALSFDLKMFLSLFGGEKKPECVSDEHIRDRWMSWLTQASAPDCHHSCSWGWLRSESWRLLGCLNLVWIISSSKSLVGRETVRYSKVWDTSDLSAW